MANEEVWYAVFGPGHPDLQKQHRLHKRLPSPPRCKLCLAPFGGLGGAYMRLRGKRPSNRNPRFCSACDHFIRAHPGGAEVMLSMVFADVRGSTALAEQVSPTELMLAPGQTVKLRLRLFDDKGRFLREETSATWTLDGLKGTTANNSFTVSKDPVDQAGLITATCP